MSDDRTDRNSYAPFILMDRGGYRALLLAEPGMEAKQHLFAEREDAGWSGNGYDWSALAQAVVAERLPQLQGRLRFDPEAGMLSVGGERADLETLGTALRALYRDDDALRDLLARAELD
ncbi:immunity 51 family protein [Lysobacter sp. 5GHs7-4]|uniref:Imm51 family immunity protein n=1 Tax=Lysobacter sp. 5GHs7-4 TaxID=2904253 RepID=UPI001E382223|nr:Imm51 family immunity protein [Lysobacter sp. 5GHs7-4]UHQ23510.1 immunity 51 family protein [Lysobacter sp. 5GHs7-4]